MRTVEAELLRAHQRIIASKPFGAGPPPADDLPAKAVARLRCVWCVRVRASSSVGARVQGHSGVVRVCGGSSSTGRYRCVLGPTARAQLRGHHTAHPRAGILACTRQAHGIIWQPTSVEDGRAH